MKKNLIDQNQIIEVKEYAQVLVDIKNRVAQAQIKAAFAANKELLMMYWDIGKMLAQKMEAARWGAKIVDQLSQDIKREFPGIAGFSKENMQRMMAFYQAYAILSQPATKLESLPFFNIPWFHNVVLIMKIKNNEERLWYAQKAVDNAWSRAYLESQIKSDLYNRQGKAITNFHRTLIAPQSDLAQETLKDPYVFDFLTLQEKHLEVDLENGLIAHVEKLLLAHSSPKRDTR